MASGKLVALLFALAAVAATTAVQPSEARIQGLERRQDDDQVLRASTFHTTVPSPSSPGGVVPPQPATRSAPPPPALTECMTPLIGMVPCMDYLTNLTVLAPPAACCDGLKAVIRDAPICLCHGMNDGMNVTSSVADSPLGSGGRSARQHPDIYLDCGTRLSYPPPHFHRPETSELVRSRHRRPLPLISLLRPQNLDSSRENLPWHLLHLPQPPARHLPGRNRLNHHRSPLEPLGALLHRRSASPVVLRPNRPREWIRGELFVLPGLFPLPLCAAGAGE